MSVILVGIVGLVGIVIGSAGFKLTYEGTRISYKYIKRKQKKKNLKNILFQNMNNLNYNEFINTIYKIKQYDERYNKNLFIKIQKQFFFTEKHFENFSTFERRFDSSYYNKQAKLKEMIKNEIELSISQYKSTLDL